MSNRMPWNEFWMRQAYLFGQRMTCPRAKVGCVLVRDNRIISAGYGGSLPGQSHCDEVGCLMIEGHCQRTSHAEINAIAHAARLGNSIDGCTAYITITPCITCYKALIMAGIQKIYYGEKYRYENLNTYITSLLVNTMSVFNGVNWYNATPSVVVPQEYKYEGMPSSIGV